jgi:quinol monooxygenase YgiN
MALQDHCCTLVPYFKVNEGKMPAFRSLCEQFVAKTQSEPKCTHYAFSFEGDTAHCREGYADADGLLTHLGNVDAILQEALKIASITRLEVHAPADQLAKLREPLKALNPQMFTVEYGFRR